MTVQSLTFIPASGASREWDWLFAGHGSQVPAVRFAEATVSAVDSVLAAGLSTSDMDAADDGLDNDAYWSAAQDHFDLLEPLLSGPKDALGF